MRIQFAALAIFAMLFLPNLAEADATNCALKQAASLDLVSDEAGDALLPVQLAGSPQRLILSLQAAYSILSDATVSKLALRRRHMPEGIFLYYRDQSANGLVRSPVQVGRLTIDNVDFAVIPRMPVGEESADGMVGMDVLRTADVDLDLAHNKLSLFLHDHCPGQVVYWQHDGGVAAIPMSFQKSGNILVNMQLDGKPVVAGIRSEGPSEMGMNAARRLFSLSKDSPDVELVPGTKSTYRHAFKSLEMPGVQVANPAISIYDQDPGQDCSDRTRLKTTDSGQVQEYKCYGGADVFLGLSVLRRLHLYFAFDEKMLYATAAQP